MVHVRKPIRLTLSHVATTIQTVAFVTLSAVIVLRLLVIVTLTVALNCTRLGQTVCSVI
jgi:hypothetical protein